MTEELEIMNLDILSEQRRLNPKSPWKKARELRNNRAAEFLTIHDLYNKVANFDNLRDQCLYLIMYITAGRIGEIVRRNVWKIGKKKVRVVKYDRRTRQDVAKDMFVQDFTKKRLIKTLKSLVKEDLTVEDFKGNKMLVLRLRNLKNKRKGENIKFIPLPLTNEMNSKINDVIQQYLNILEPEEELFPFGERRAEQIINKAGFNPHFLRSCRLTHLVKYHNFSDQKLKVFAGWSDSRPSRDYIRIGHADIANSMI